MENFLASVIVGLGTGLLFLLLLWKRADRHATKLAQEQKTTAPDPVSFTAPVVSMLPVTPEEYIKVARTVLQKGHRVWPGPLPGMLAAEGGLTYEMVPPRARPVLHAILVFEIAQRQSSPVRKMFTPLVLQSTALAATMAALVYEEEMVFPTPPLDRGGLE